MKTKQQRKLKKHSMEHKLNDAEMYRKTNKQRGYQNQRKIAGIADENIDFPKIEEQQLLSRDNCAYSPIMPSV
jgi:hypothetical protein